MDATGRNGSGFEVLGGPDVKAYYPGNPQQRTIFQTSGTQLTA
jgi:hypothetical protein